MSLSDMVETRRVKQIIVLFLPSILQDMITTGWHIPNNNADLFECITGIPDTAHYIRGFYDAEHDRFGLVFESEDFPETPEGQPLPIIRPVFGVRHPE